MSIPPEAAERLREELRESFDREQRRVHVDGGLLFNEETGKPDGAQMSVEVELPPEDES